MRVPRLHVEGRLGQEHTLSLGRERSHYLLRVLRRQPGDEVIVFDDAGAAHSAHVVAGDSKQCQLEIGPAVVGDLESPLDVRLALPVLRGDRMDVALQKAVELGVRNISLLTTARSEVKLERKRQANKMRHWREVVIHACQQSGRTRRPELAQPEALADWLTRSAADTAGDRLLLDPSGVALPMTTDSGPVTLLVGPEGGFADSELTHAADVGFRIARLGPRVLRAETAPVAALAVLQWRVGDLGQ